ncbi:MAG: hypothetical protein RL641_573 [Candidatus Parcubacteria bacterium]|jgi:exopolysaccharide biosynthesis polyprenyl glycosylphosphotransferase
MLRKRQLGQLFGDLVLYSLAFLLTLYIRYGNSISEQIPAHFAPFAFLFIWWVMLFYINDLYELEFTRNWIFVIRKIVSVCVVATLGAALIFYFFGGMLTVAPKTNLILFSLLFSFFIVSARLYVVMRRRVSPLSVLLLGESEEIKTLEHYFADKFTNVVRVSTMTEQEFSKYIGNTTLAYIIFDEKEKQMLTAFHVLMPLLRADVKIMTTTSAYEYIFKKIPIKEISSAWFLEYIHLKKLPFDPIKRIIDIVFSAILIVALSPIFIICGLLVLLFTGQPIIYSQERVGKNGKLFRLRKFRSMVRDAENTGPQWSMEKDPRVTKLGKFLRASHLDEIPQLFSIFAGKMSFVGPRPERPHFVESLAKDIPYFEIRHAIKPGLTGWAQIRHGYTSDTAAFFEKFQYDLYYIKNRSLVFDALVVLKTVRKFM